MTSIESLWSCIYHVLCADAPEGHVPDEIEDEGSLDTKEILSYLTEFYIVTLRLKDKMKKV